MSQINEIPASVPISTAGVNRKWPTCGRNDADGSTATSAWLWKDLPIACERSCLQEAAHLGPASGAHSSEGWGLSEISVARL